MRRFIPLLILILILTGIESNTQVGFAETSRIYSRVAEIGPVSFNQGHNEIDGKFTDFYIFFAAHIWNSDNTSLQFIAGYGCPANPIDIKLRFHMPFEYYPNETFVYQEPVGEVNTCTRAIDLVQPGLTVRTFNVRIGSRLGHHEVIGDQYIRISYARNSNNLAAYIDIVDGIYHFHFDPIPADWPEGIKDLMEDPMTSRVSLNMTENFKVVISLLILFRLISSRKFR